MKMLYFVYVTVTNGTRIWIHILEFNTWWTVENVHPADF